MKKIIPSVTIVKCDRCGVETENDAFLPNGIRMNIHRYSRDAYGNMGGHRSDYDICTTCCTTFERFIKGISDE